MEETKKIRIKYFTDKIDRLTYIGGKSDWIDLRCAKNIQMKPGQTAEAGKTTVISFE